MDYSYAKIQGDDIDKDTWRLTDTNASTALSLKCLKADSKTRTRYRRPSVALRRKMASIPRLEYSRAATDDDDDDSQIEDMNLRPHSADPRKEELSAPDMRQTISEVAVASAVAGKCYPDPQSFNALYDVSQEFMRLSGYTPRYTWLLSNAVATIQKDPLEVQRNAGQFFNEERDNEGRIMFRPHHSKYYEADATQKPALEDQLYKNYGASSDIVSGRRRPARAQNFYALQKRGREVYHTKRQLMDKRTGACDFSVVLSLIGLILIVIEEELTANGTVEKNGYVAVTLMSVTLASTIILLLFVIRYHWLTAKILMITTGADDWRVTIQFHRVLQCTVESLVCMICPLPWSIKANWQILSQHNHRNVSQTVIPLDTILAVLMFLRAYLVCRFVALHNKRYQDPATRSIAALNHVNVDFPFALKTMMHERPLGVLVTFAVTFWLVMSWLLTQCERYNEIPEGNHYLNSVWFIVVTFTSIGYGDLVPQTYCGRALAIATGIMGAGVSSVLIAVISKRMQLTRAEKQVNQFINDSKLSRIKKDTAASILQHTWFIYRYKKSPSRIDQHKLRMHQRKFLNAAYQTSFCLHVLLESVKLFRFRSIKWNQRRLDEEGRDLLDLPKLQNQMQQSLSSLKRGQETMAAQMQALEKVIDKITANQRSVTLHVQLTANGQGRMPSSVKRPYPA